jgi:hypothetical protein
MKLGASIMTWRVTVDVLQRGRWTMEYRGVDQLETAPGDTDRARSLVALEKPTYDLPCRAELGGDFLVRCEDRASLGKMT